MNVGTTPRAHARDTSARLKARNRSSKELSCYSPKDPQSPSQLQKQVSKFHSQIDATRLAEPTMSSPAREKPQAHTTPLTHRSRTKHTGQPSNWGHHHRSELVSVSSWLTLRNCVTLIPLLGRFVRQERRMSGPRQKVGSLENHRTTRRPELTRTGLAPQPRPENQPAWGRQRWKAARRRSSMLPFASSTPSHPQIVNHQPHHEFEGCP